MTDEKLSNHKMNLRHSESCKPPLWGRFGGAFNFSQISFCTSVVAEAVNAKPEHPVILLSMPQSVNRADENHIPIAKCNALHLLQ